MNNPHHGPIHFKGKNAVAHVVEAQAKGIIAKGEGHGIEPPGHITASADTSRELGLCSLIAAAFLYHNSHPDFFIYFSLFCLSWAVWRAGRSAWLGWTRLERLHRIVAEEKWEIDHHRDQEREELSALYEAKGFQGKLLEDVIDVLMADGDRLLRVMIEEELGLTLENQEHPLKQGMGSLLGALATFSLISIGFFLSGAVGMALASFLVIAVASYFLASYNRNRKTAAILWNLGLAFLSSSIAYFMYQFLTS